MIPREVLKKVRRVEVRTKGLVQDVFGGQYHSAFKGRGIEFSEVRPYQMGDDVRTIDWNVSARMGEPFVKVFHEEREQTLLLAVDVSGSNDFGSASRSKRDAAAEIGAVLGFSAVRNADKVGLLLFSDQVERFVPPKKGRRHVLRLLRDVFVHEPESRGTDLAFALDHAARMLKRRAIVLLISDFLDRPLAFGHALRACAARHDVVAVHLTDPREEALPNAGLVTLRDAETGRAVLVDTGSRRARALYAHAAEERRERLARAFASARVDVVEARVDEDVVAPLAAFFRRRNRTGR